MTSPTAAFAGGEPEKPRVRKPADGERFSFWHLMSEGKEEQKRAPDLERCARIPWGEAGHPER